MSLSFLDIVMTFHDIPPSFLDIILSFHDIDKAPSKYVLHRKSVHIMEYFRKNRGGSLSADHDACRFNKGLGVDCL